jgi:hypothetical protein
MSGRCECAVCVRSAGLTAVIDNAKLGNNERGPLLDLVADWWALAHGPEEKSATENAESAKGAKPCA